ncbi:Molecular chaperone IbpA, HSP20 family [Tenuibacillus multivorans]|uniref:Molecular chaperone IbpA, HSP20 family n=2 Tax=Tenuibacillus multivorans TaxID=237069 RepID=A0A1H0DD77_9BACI|nr:Molecular chaperone IbpA, HSP20 family [Tenuibacillus multivorans]
MELINDFFQSKHHQSLMHNIDQIFQPNQKIIPIDISENRSFFIITATLAGIPKENINLELMGDQLIININHKNNPYEKRKVDLPSYVTPNGMKARHRDGILQIKFPKIKGESIEIN